MSMHCPDCGCPRDGTHAPTCVLAPREGRQRMAAARPCTCHPADNPPNPCAQRYALSECLKHGEGYPGIAHDFETLKLRAERMRRALHDIVEEWAGAECGEPVHAQEAYAIGLAKRMYALATDALAPNVGAKATTAAQMNDPERHNLSAAVGRP